MGLYTYTVYQECDGFWRAVRNDRMRPLNVAPSHCRTQSEAILAAEEDRAYFAKVLRRAESGPVGKYLATIDKGRTRRDKVLHAARLIAYTAGCQRLTP